MADSVEQCRLLPTAALGANDHFARAFDLNHAVSDTEDDDSFTGTGTDTDTSSDGSEPTSSVSDCESGVSGNSTSYSSAAAAGSAGFPCFDDGMIRLSYGDKAHDLIKGRFVSGLGQLREKTTVAAIHRNCYSSPTAQARAQAFQIYLQATQKKRVGDANVKYAWYAASKEDMAKIMCFGFGHCGNTSNGLFGSGIYLSPDNHPLESVKFAPLDKDGMRHLLLCRVILGKSELIHPGSEQHHPSSEEFDSGVDSLSCPKKYIVWSTHMNTHVLPEYVVSFRMPCCLKGLLETQSPLRKPTSPWMPFSMLISELSKILPAPTIGSISKYHKDYKEKKISRQELIRKMRQFTGDKLLIAVIKSFRSNKLRAASDFPRKEC
ncbi:probable inactive poly [ADP-ribose] polymerase SRO5 isoform X1 [Punica granatum]|uniref:Uncharacterized protein n=2 Tax=Punica granatum TaxID=22663 RepID=A0A2I0HI44_PUNGR|nr:probable inactive poly [ADP-ribose] polymerase SRO5 isoform X1 [Punica granatum]PKI31355.1 hypothetical protein CRG98_048252 [Punica granatum]